MGMKYLIISYCSRENGSSKKNSEICNASTSISITKGTDICLLLILLLLLLSALLLLLLLLQVINHHCHWSKHTLVAKYDNYHRQLIYNGVLSFCSCFKSSKKHLRLLGTIKLVLSINLSTGTHYMNNAWMKVVQWKLSWNLLSRQSTVQIVDPIADGALLRNLRKGFHSRNLFTPLPKGTDHKNSVIHPYFEPDWQSGPGSEADSYGPNWSRSGSNRALLIPEFHMQ